MFTIGSVVFSLTSGNQVSIKELGKPSLRVIIVGAGVSGVAAASKLIQNGITNITILEAMDRIGGRINYKKIGDSGVDLGAHWIHGQGKNVVYELAEPLGLVDHSDDYKTQLFVRPNGSVQESFGKSFIEFHMHLMEEMSRLEGEERSQSFVDFVHSRLTRYGETQKMDKKLLESLERHLLKTLCTVSGCADIADVSLKSIFDYEEAEGDGLIHWKKGGMLNIIQLLMGTHEKSPWSGLGVEDKVKLSTKVTKIDWSGEDTDGVKVTTDQGTVESADFLIFTPSLNVLKAKHKDIFTPPLPENKVNAIEALGMDVVDKVYFVYDKPWWPKDGISFHLLHDVVYTSQSKDWEDDIIMISTEQGNPNVICTWLVGSAAKQMEASSDQEVISTCMRMLRNFAGNHYNVTEPNQMIRSQWWNNENVKGSYSYNSVASELLETPRQDLAQPLSGKQAKPVVMFAGEATNTNRYACVHGALETGWREADRVIDYLKNHTK